MCNVFIQSICFEIYEISAVLVQVFWFWCYPCFFVHIFLETTKTLMQLTILHAEAQINLNHLNKISQYFYFLLRVSSISQVWLVSCLRRLAVQVRAAGWWRRLVIFRTNTSHPPSSPSLYYTTLPNSTTLYTLLSTLYYNTLYLSL